VRAAARTARVIRRRTGLLLRFAKRTILAPGSGGNYLLVATDCSALTCGR
jgi:hypothetical protein